MKKKFTDKFGNIRVPQRQYLKIRFNLVVPNESGEKEPYILKDNDTVVFSLDTSQFTPIKVANPGNDFVDIQMPTHLPKTRYRYIAKVDNPNFTVEDIKYSNFLRTEGEFEITRSD